MALEQTLGHLEAVAIGLQQYHEEHGPHARLTPERLHRQGDGSIRISEAPSQTLSVAVLRYASPGVAGRISDIGTSTDLYSLGVMAYEWLSGENPFRSNDPLLLAHEQMSYEPPPLHPAFDVPPPVSDLVERLLQKSRHRRYATVGGLIRDIRRCRKDLETTGTVSWFSLGTDDDGSVLQFRDHLYGRDREIAALDDMYQRALAGEVIVCTMAGYSGIGKTSLVRSLREPVARANGFLVEGKYDQNRRTTPYLAMIEVFSSLIRSALARPEEEVADFRRKIRRRVGPAIAALEDLLPGLVALIGAQDPVPDLPPDAARSRMHLAFGQLLRVFATAEHPLVVFVDDLQWADQASLDLLEYLVVYSRGANVLFVGAFRDNEIGPGHPLVPVLESLNQRVPDVMVELVLNPLAPDDVHHFVADTLRSLQEVDDLASFIVRRSGGNPFFIRQLLLALDAEEALVFDPDALRWRWYPDRAREMTATDNVVELLTQRLSRRDETAQDLLRLAATVGKQFDRSVLEAILPSTEAENTPILAIRDELIRPVDGEVQNQVFVFAHDRIQQAAAALDRPQSVEQLHLRIGRHLLRSEADVPSAVVAEHLISGLSLTEDADQRDEVATICARAGEESMATLAYDAASRYFEIALDLAGPDSWATDYQRLFPLALHATVVGSLIGSEERVDALLETLHQYAEPGVDQLRVIRQEVVHHMQHDRPDVGLEIGLRGLRTSRFVTIPDEGEDLIGPFEAEARRFIERVGGVNAASTILALEPNENEEIEEIVEVIAAISDAAVFVALEMILLLSAQAANLSLDHGVSDLTTMLYFLTCLGAVKHIDAVPEVEAIGEAATELLLSGKYPAGRAWVGNLWYVYHWTHHPLEAESVLDEAIEASRREHSPGFTAYHLNVRVLYRFLLGQSLSDVVDAQLAVDRHCDEFGLEMPRALTAPLRACALALAGKTASVSNPDGHGYDHARATEEFGEINIIMSVTHGACAVNAALAGEWQRAIDCADHPSIELSPILPSHLAVNFWKGVAHANLAGASPEGDDHLVELDRCIEVNQRLLDRGQAQNVEHRLLFLQAERRRVTSDRAIDDEIAELYRQAGAAAEANSYLIEHGYILRRYGRFLQRSGAPVNTVRPIWERAAASWRSAQAFGLLPPLTDAINELGSHSIHVDASAEIALNPIETQAVLRSMETLAAELDVDTLLSRVLPIMRSAGAAQRAVFVQMVDGEIEIETGGESWHSSQRIPSGLVRYVLQSREPWTSIEVGSAAGLEAIEAVGEEDYVEAHRPAAILCLPIGRRDNPTRALILEHDELERVFTRDRLWLLQWLAGQASISIENAELYASLENRVRERTRALTESNADLEIERRTTQAARAEAEAATAAKSQFLANMSHEVRTPMNAILGLAELLSAGNLEPEQRRWLRSLELSAELLLGIIDDILDLSKIEAGQIVLDQSVFHLSDLVDATIQLIRPGAEDKGIELSIDIDPRTPDVLVGDPLRLSQCLLNLLSNAVKFTPDGSIRFGVEPVDGTSTSTTLAISVADTGIGIAPERLDGLMDPFIQADASVSRQFGGTGLGLAITDQLARVMGGRVEIASEPGVGSTFTLILPFDAGDGGSQGEDFTLTDRTVARYRKESSVDQERRPAPARSSVDRPSRALSDLSILLVEDDELNAEVAVSRLQLFGIEVTVLGDGRSAVEWFEDHDADLILMDCHMPVMDGYAATREIRATERGRSVPIVALSAMATSDDVERSLAAGMDDHVTKPVHLAKLVSTIRKWTIDRPSGPAGTILVVDDDELLRSLLVRILRDDGYDVMEAADGADALELVEADAGRIDLALIDRVMPGIDGDELFRRLHATHPSIRTVLLTGDQRDEGIDALIELGLDTYLLKPVTSADLLATASRLLGLAGTKSRSDQSQR